MQLKIREMRLARGLSQDALARSVGCAHSAIYKLERPSANPRTRTLVKIAIALQCSLEDLVSYD